MVASAWRAAADDAVELRPHEQVSEAGAVRGDTRMPEGRADLVTRERMTSVEGLLEDPSAAREGGCIESKLPVSARGTGDQPGCDQVQHPPQVLRRDEVPGATHHVGAKDATARNGSFDGRVFGRTDRHSEPHSPLRRGGVLGLHCAEPLDDVRRAREGAARDALRSQSLSCEQRPRLRPPCASHVAGDAGDRVCGAGRPPSARFPRSRSVRTPPADLRLDTMPKCVHELEVAGRAPGLVEPVPGVERPVGKDLEPG